MPDDVVASQVTPAATTEGHAASDGFTPPVSPVRDFLARYEAAEETTEDTSEVKPEAKTEPKTTTESKPVAPLPDVKNLQTLAKDGKYKEVLEALGIEVDGAKIPSDRFAKFRKLQKEERGKLEARATAIAEKEAKVNQQITTVLKDYEGLAKAKRAWDDGDVVGAIEAAFGEDLESISDRALKQKLASDPELHKLKRKLEAKEKAEQEQAEQARQQQAQRVKSQQELQYLQTLGTELQAAEDSTIAKAAKIPSFVRSVMNAQLHVYRTQGVELSADDAAADVLKTIRDAHLSWSEVFGPSGSASTENTVATGKQSLITDRTGKSSEKPKTRGVSQVRATASPAVPDSALSSEDLLAKYKKKLTQAAREEFLGRD